MAGNALATHDLEAARFRTGLGQSKRGVDLGPGALRCAGLVEKLQALEHRFIDGGNLEVAVRETLERPEHHQRLHISRDMDCLNPRSDQVSAPRRPSA